MRGSFHIPTPQPRDDADRLGDLSAELRAAQATLTALSEECGIAAQRVARLQNEHDALREAILG